MTGRPRGELEKRGRKCPRENCNKGKGADLAVVQGLGLESRVEDGTGNAGAKEGGV